MSGNQETEGWGSPESGICAQLSGDRNRRDVVHRVDSAREIHLFACILEHCFLLGAKQLSVAL